MNNYEKLTAALGKAAEAARPLGDTDDGGTCNFDSLELSLPRYNAKNTIEAIAAAGLRGFRTTQFGTTVYLIHPPVSRQGNARTRQAEAMRDVMKKLGYSASVWYQMD